MSNKNFCNDGYVLYPCCPRHMWLLNISNVASVTEKLNFMFCLILININVNLYSHMFAVGYNIRQIKSNSQREMLLPENTA